MRELTFFTSNQTKLAHARYIAEGSRVRIRGFRQRTYHADYTEPRLASREAILQASYASAKAQMAKAGLSEATHAFVLEDTSVRINALSDARTEVPGVDIKYWMEDRTFESLDTLLRAAGNDRSASVRSDVLLHVPDALRKAWQIETAFLIFTGEQRGRIVDHEIAFEPNPVYPWLDNRSFNKWFVPDGCEAPLGTLPISIADQADFRRKAFSPLFQFLEKRRYFPADVKQLQLHLDAKPNIVLCGYTCAGKTTASQHLARRFGYLHVEASDFMHLSYYYRNGYGGPASIGDFAERALREMPTIAAERVVDYVRDHLSEPIVISGFRAPEEIAFLEKALKDQGKQFALHFVVADEATRYERLRARARPGDDLSLVQFRERDRQQDRMGLNSIHHSSEMKQLNNIASLSAYLEAVNAVVGDHREDEIDVEASLGALASVDNAGLQDAILVALLSVWADDEARRFYTTTEISGLIGSALPGIRPKHKDNVSRYFNQDFYAYYEISSSSDGAKRRYRLSNTGYGMAIRALREMAVSFADLTEK